MKALSTLLGLVRNHPWWVTAHIVSNVLTALFTVLTLPLVIPIFQLFFSGETESIDVPAGGWSISDAPDWINYHLVNWLQEESTRTGALIKSCLVLISVFLLKNVFQYLSLFFIAPVRTGVMRDLRQLVYDKLTWLPLSFYSDERRGDLLSRFTSDVYEVEFSILGVLERLVRDPLIIFGALFFMLSISAKLAAIVLVMLIVTGAVIGVVTSRLKRQSQEAQTTMGRLLSTIEETVAGMQVIKAFNAEQFMQRRMHKDNDTHQRLLVRLFWRKDVASPLSEVLGIIAVCALFILGAYMVEADEIRPEVFLTFIMAFYYTIDPAKKVANGYAQLQKGSAAYERIDHILQQPVDQQEMAHLEVLPEMKKGISVHDLHYRYAPDLPDVLHGVSFDLIKGQTVAFVGSSGSGKTTMAELLMGFHRPRTGHIAMDDIDSSEVKLSAWRGQMGVVTQKPVLFNDTIRANIAFGRELTDEAIESAAKMAYAHEFIEALPDGYEHFVGDEGQKLSGGQRQRIAIARAIADDPDILILDEATSALDAESEKAVQRALEQVLADRTAVVIAHRLSTIQHADRIIVFEDGRIIESGTHADLLDGGGAYAKFVGLQQMH